MWAVEKAGGSIILLSFFFSSRRRHTRLQGDWSSDVCSSDLIQKVNAHLTTKLYKGEPELVVDSGGVVRFKDNQAEHGFIDELEEAIGHPVTKDRKSVV